MRTLTLIVAIVTCIQSSRAGDDPTAEQIEKFVREALQQKQPVTNYDQPLVPTAEAAVAIHKAVTTGIYGRDGIGQEPFRALRSGEFWVVYGDLPKGFFGGVPITVIRASDGKVMWVTASGQ
jgi:hypothetical protein